MRSVVSIKASIADEMPEQLPASSQVGKTRVGGIDLNKPRMRWGRGGIDNHYDAIRLAMKGVFQELGIAA